MASQGYGIIQNFLQYGGRNCEEISFVNGPRAIPILTCERNGKVKVHEDALQEIFRRPEVQDKPVCIVSISGAFRQGKSFMQNFFVRYLRNKGHINDSWMGDADAPMMDGFDWRGGRRACTNGILMWSEVFIVERDDDEVAVILMDTQGLFDNKTSKKSDSIIFALSTLISSVKIFNLKQQIQENDLEFLQFFTAYAKAANRASPDKSVTPFQSLIFLVRDWPYEVEFPYGTDGGANYLEEVLSDESTSEELSSVRKYLRSSFDDTRCCLMPHPGQKVATTSESFGGCLRDIEDEFVRQVISFVDSLFKPPKLVPKTINGQEVSALAILQYITDCSASLTDGTLPNPKTMMETVAEAQNFEAQKRCTDKYTQAVNEIMGESFVDDDILEDTHVQAESVVMKDFQNMSQFGSDESRRKHRDHLETNIRRDHGMFVQRNRSAKVEAESICLNKIEGIANHYEENMKGETHKLQFISDEKLDEIHAVHAREAHESFVMDENVNRKLKDEYFEKLQEKLDRIYEAIKSDNFEKKRIAEEQNETTRKMMILELQCAIGFRDEMRKRVEDLMDDFEESAETCRRMAMDDFQVKALEIKVMPGSETFQKHFAGLKAKLDEEYEHITKINGDKKDTLKKTLESYGNKAIVEYEKVFKTLLKNTYVEKKDLRKRHDEVVANSMSSLRSAVGNKSHLSIVKHYLQETESELNGKYGMIDEWNEKNNTFLRKCFKVAKTFAMPVIAAVGFLKKIF